MHALAGHLQEGELAWLLGARHVEHLQAALPARRVRLERAALVVDQQHVVDHLDLVRVGAWRCFQLGDHAWAARIRHIDHRRADPSLAHVADERETVLEVDVHAVAVAVEVGLADQAQVQSVGV